MTDLDAWLREILNVTLQVWSEVAACGGSSEQCTRLLGCMLVSSHSSLRPFRHANKFVEEKSAICLFVRPEVPRAQRGSCAEVRIKSSSVMLNFSLELP